MVHNCDFFVTTDPFKEIKYPLSKYFDFTFIAGDEDARGLILLLAHVQKSKFSRISLAPYK